MSTRICTISIIIENREEVAPQVNNLLSSYGDNIVARLGIPLKHRGIFVINVVIEGTTDEIGALTGQLGQIPGLQIKSITV